MLHDALFFLNWEGAVVGVVSEGVAPEEAGGGEEGDGEDDSAEGGRPFETADEALGRDRDSEGNRNEEGE